ncbi:hypothetical protein [uncultured Clostridium sp.]|uniref:hypothetical protein n=1 Tax=uncultured Clostridium sp. TaxID=59620 RepID=UPI0025F862DB|nr:hypothetical protein [uncultured Clostridium sp.]
MVNKKISRIIGSAAGIMGFMMAMGVVSIPAYAAEAVISQSLDAGYEMNQNGVKFKVNKIVGTKHRVKIDAVIQMETGIEDYSHGNLQFNIYMDDNHEGGSSMSWGNSDEKTVKITAIDENDEEFAPTGKLRIDAVMGEYDFNGSLIIPVDFTEDFKQNMEKQIDEKINDNMKIIKFESDAISTRLIVDEPERNFFLRRAYDESTSFIIKADDKIYTLNSHGTTNDENDYTVYENEGLTFNDIKDAEEIRIIPLKCNMTDKERENYYNDMDEDSYSDKITEDKVNYTKEMSFDDGTKGEFKAERADNKIKLYCSSDSDKKSFLMASEIEGFFTGDEEDGYYYGHEDLHSSVYKDKDKEHVYVAEFDDINKNMTFEVFFDGLIKNIDKFEIGNEISVK